MIEYMLQFGALGVFIIGSFFWFQYRAQSNRRVANSAHSRIDKHETLCTETNKLVAKEQAETNRVLERVITTQDNHSKLLDKQSNKMDDVLKAVTRLETKIDS